MRKINAIFRCSLFFLTLALFSYCKKEPTPSPCEQLQGNWECTSWTADDFELMGAFIAYSYLDFSEMENSSADYDWVYKNIDGGSEVLDGSYTLNSDCSEVVLRPTIMGGMIEMDFKVENEQLVLEGFNAGYYQKMTFKRK